MNSPMEEESDGSSPSSNTNNNVASGTTSNKHRGTSNQHHNDRNGSIAMGTRARGSNAQRRSTALELQDCEDALEHIVMTGNHFRHRAWRIDTWKKRNKSQSENKDRNSATVDDADGSGGQQRTNLQDGSEESDRRKSRPTKKRKRNHDEDEASISHSDQEGQDSSDDGSSTEKAKDTKGNALHLLHGDDIRLYGHASGCAADPWPRDLRGGRRNRYKDRAGNEGGIDAPWNEQFGDSIPLFEFTRDRLSTVVPSNTTTTTTTIDDSTTPFSGCKETEALLVPERMRQLDPDTVRCTVDRNHVPRALLLRCWQRAVDIASQSTLVQPTGSSTNNHDVQFHTTDTTTDATRRMQLQKSAQQRCIELTIEKYPWGAPREPPYQCRLCTAEFESMDALKKHFYGSDHVRGCSWSEIHAKQRQMISDVLVQEIDGQAQALVQLVMNKALERKLTMIDDKAGNEAPKRQKKGDQQPQPKQPELFNWKDVLGFLNEVMATSQESQQVVDDDDNDNNTEQSDDGSANTTVPEIQKTLKYQNGLAPLVLNQQVLNASSSWLIERYADVPK
ncbi:expressed unknown protein [Seminavis robusta]|uniref:C2H2-type domain-containing protein n=1 Tax=Seminavis robusta TaxID=568900 RepID=A0A9N8DVI9_9STRA|nr:expressed unknown protein [Seminavis robusta]|eukprot:Sro277_g106200.3  (562) ;mRNA; r:21058-22743